MTPRHVGVDLLPLDGLAGFASARARVKAGTYRGNRGLPVELAKQFDYNAPSARPYFGRGGQNG